MGSTYSFWKQLNKDQKMAKQRYLQMFYNLQFRHLVCLSCHFHQIKQMSFNEQHLNTYYILYIQAKQVPVPEEASMEVSEPTPDTPTKAEDTTKQFGVVPEETSLPRSLKK